MDFKWDAIENSFAFIVIGAIAVLGQLVGLDPSSSSVAIAAIAGLAGNSSSKK
jgi:hypothetical protein